MNDGEDSKSDGDKKASAKFGILPGLLGYNVRRANVKFFQNFSEIVAGHDVTPGQFGVLAIIEANPGLNQSELGQAMGVDRSTVVAVIDRLEGRGLVVRDPSPKDRRSYALRLSDIGVKLLHDLIPMVEKYDRQAAHRLSDEEVVTLVDLLRRMVGDT
jgi:DNA-binding MarR family transcriptional regulator